MCDNGCTTGIENEGDTETVRQGWHFGVGKTGIDDEKRKERCAFLRGGGGV